MRYMYVRVMGWSIAVLLMMPLWSAAQLSVSSVNSALTITFDETQTGVTNGQFTGTGLNPNPAAGQLNSNAWSVIGLSEGDTDFGGTHESGDYARGASTGGTTSGGMYAFDISGGGNHALGFQPTSGDFRPGSLRLKVTNATGQEVTEVRLAYTLYIYNDQTRANSFNGSYSLDNSTYTEVTDLNYTSEEAADATPSWTSVSKEVTLSLATPLASGAEIFLGWFSDDVSGSGSRDEFALDNISVTFNPEASTGNEPDIQLERSEFTAFFGEVVEGEFSTPDVYSILATNLTGPLTLSVPEHFQVSTDNGETFTSAEQTFEPVNGEINQSIVVRFAPTTAGNQSGDLVHRSSGVTERLTLSGIALPGAGVLLAEDFESCPENTPEGWTVFTVGSGAAWECTQYGRGNGSFGMQISGFNAAADTEGWLISPALNMDELPAEELSFWARTRFNGPMLQVLYSNNYTTGDPTAASWSEVVVYNLPATNSDIWQQVRADLSAVTGTNVRLAFKYTGTPTLAARWTVDDVYLQSGDGIIELPNVAALRRAGAGTETTFRLTGEAALTFQLSNRNQKFIQDETGGILIDDSRGTITSTYNINDGITGLTGTLSVFGGMLQFVPTEDPGAATATGLEPRITTVTLSELNTNFEAYESQLVRVEGVQFNTTGEFTTAKVYEITDGSTTYNFRTNFFNADYIGTEVPGGTLELIGIPNSRSDGNYITARSLADFKAESGGGTTTVVLVNQDFSDNCADLAGWTTYNEVGDQVWACNSNGRTGSGYQISGYSGSNFANRDWFISPAIDPSAYTNETLLFAARTRFAGNPLEVMYSVDYDGSADPTTFTWVAVPGISLPAMESDVWQDVTGDLSTIEGNQLYVAFVYSSTTEASARWTLDDIQITAETTEAVASISTDLTNFTPNFGSVNVGETSASSAYSITATNLKQDLTITAPEGFQLSTDDTQFSSSLSLTPTSGQVSTTIYVRFAPTIATEYNAEIVHTSGIARATVTVSGMGQADNSGAITSVAQLRQQAIGGTYTLSSEVILTYQQNFRGQKFVQDATGGILIDDHNDGDNQDGGDVITTAYQVGDGITGLTGTLSEFGNMLQFVPTEDPGAATSTGNEPTVTPVTLEELSNNFDEYESRLVEVKNVNFAGTGTFANNQVYEIADPTANFNFRATFFDVDYIGSQLPGQPQTIVGIPNARSNGNFFTARNTADFSVYIPEPVVLLREDFSTCFPENGWTAVSVSSDKDWRCTTSGFEGQGAEINGFQQTETSEDWLISPALNMGANEGEILQFMSERRFGNDDTIFELRYSTDYTGAGTVESVQAASWQTLSFTKPTAESVWTNSGNIDLSSISGTAYLAFYYKAESSPRRWRIDDVVVEVPGQLPVEITFMTDGFSGAFGNVAVGATSLTRSFSLNVINASEAITVSAPAGFQISLDNNTFSNELSLTAEEGTLENQIIYVRFAPQVAGELMAEIRVSSGAVSQSVSVSGTGVTSAVSVLAQDFSTCFPENGWTAVSLGSDKDWRCTTSGYAGAGAEINGYQQTETSNDWLISPALNLDAQDNEMLSFYSQYRFGDETTQFTLKYSSNYDGGGTKEAIEAATWQELTFTKPSAEDTWEYSGLIDLSELNGTVHLAFHYLAESSSPRRWRVDEVKVASEAPVTIASVRTLNQDGTSQYLNSQVTLTGVVHGSNSYTGNSANGLEFRLIDAAEGAGITVYYSGSTDLGYTVTEGDELTVTGTVGNRMGLTTLLPANITQGAGSQPLAERQTLNGEPITEMHESMPIRLEGVSVLQGWEEPVNGIYYVVVSDDDNQYVVRFDAALSDWSGIKNSSALSLNGFGYQLDETIPYDAGYMLTVSSPQDVDVMNSLEDDLLQQTVNLYPNPATSLVRFNGLQQNAQVEVRDTAGRLLMQTTLAAAQPELSLPRYAAGLYVVTLRTKTAKASYRLLIK